MDIVTHIVKYNAQTNGRDKLCRLFQYASKLSWWYLERMKTDPTFVTRFKNLETNLSATRKVLRIGKSLDMIQGAIKSFYVKDALHRLTLTLSKLNQACYLLVDHFIWAGKVGLVNTNTKKWARVSARFWLITIICNLTRNVYDLCNILRIYLARGSRLRVKQNGVGGESSSGSSSGGQVSVSGCLMENSPVVVDVVKNVSDLFLPLSSLGYIKTSGGFQGVMGMLGSLMGILVVWNPSLKQSPA